MRINRLGTIHFLSDNYSSSEIYILNLFNGLNYVIEYNILY